jgi:hypothetical protein
VFDRFSLSDLSFRVHQVGCCVRRFCFALCALKVAGRRGCGTLTRGPAEVSQRVGMKPLCTVTTHGRTRPRRRSKFNRKREKKVQVSNHKMEVTKNGDEAFSAG